MEKKNFFVKNTPSSCSTISVEVLSSIRCLKGLSLAVQSRQIGKKYLSSKNFLYLHRKVSHVTLGLSPVQSKLGCFKEYAIAHLLKLC